jgi:hypothetical protein
MKGCRRILPMMISRIVLLMGGCSMLAFSADEPKSPATAPVVADAKATGEWLARIFTVKDGQVLVMGKPPEKYREARLPFAKATEIKFESNLSIIADQEGMYPVGLGLTDEGYRFYMYQPFRDFLDRIIEEDGLPGYGRHPKAEAMKNEGFRAIAEVLHAHFTKETGQLPERHRVLDGILYPSETYIWSVGKQFIFLVAYNGNDSDGLYCYITFDASRLDELRKRKHTEEEVYRGWGQPMLSRKDASQK